MWGYVYVNGTIGSVSGVKRPERDVFSTVSGVSGDKRQENYTPDASKGMVCRAAARPKNLKKNAEFVHVILQNTFRGLLFSRNELMTGTLEF
jgi:hypothetical protein